MAVKWRRVLFEEQNVPDNFVAPTFLANLRKNVNLRKYTYSEAFFGTSVVTHAISCAALFVITFADLRDETYSIATFVSAIAFMIFSCSILHQYCEKKWYMFDKTTSCNFAKSCFIYLCFGYMFSPILKTLTETISTDTVYSMTSGMLVLHLIFHNYGVKAAIVSPTLSLNFALFAAVCLVSRMPTVTNSFVFIVVTVQIFVLMPILRNKLKSHTRAHLSVTLGLVVVIFVALCDYSLFHACVFLCVCFGINFILPSLFVYGQLYKANIFGPWDEAVVNSQ